MNVDSELAFFCLLVKQGSLAATARELNLTPPAVSRRLSQLEDRLGVRLLNRTTRRINLTTHIDEVVELLEREDLGEVVLCGHSYGGMVITAVAEANPPLVSRTV